MNAYEETPNTEWLREQAILWRAEGLKCYRAHQDTEAIRLLDMADQAWHLIRAVQAVPKRARRQRQQPTEAHHAAS